MRRHLFIPDCQVTPDTPTDHLEWIGKYWVEQKPDVVVQIGDFADMESLSSYDKGKKEFEGRRYWKDIDASLAAMRVLTKPLTNYNKKKAKHKEKQYKPEMHLTMGNHEYRIERVVSDDARLEGTLSLSDLEYEHFGFTVHPFLTPVEIDGVYYCHYFSNPMNGRPYGGNSIDTRLKTIGFSFVAGHQQVNLTGMRYLNNGRRLRGLVCGACYLHDENYMGVQGNSYWRGIFILNEVHDGSYDLVEVSLDYLCRKYEGVRLWQFMLDKYPDIFHKSAWLQHQQRER